MSEVLLQALVESWRTTNGFQTTRLSGAELGELAISLEQFLIRARSERGELQFSPVDFCRYLGKLGSAEAELPTYLNRLVAGDLLLTHRVLEQDSEALSLLERQYLLPIARRSKSPTPADEFLQDLRVHLLATGGNGAVRLRQYRGTGALRAWLKMIATRLDIDRSRRRRAKPDAARSEEIDAERLIGELDPEAAFLKERYVGIFNEALERSISLLSASDAAILKLSYVEGVNAADVGRIFGLSGRTIQRRLLSIREELMSKTRERVSAELQLDTSEVDSVLDLVKSQLHVTLARVLK